MKRIVGMTHQEHVEMAAAIREIDRQISTLIERVKDRKTSVAVQDLIVKTSYTLGRVRSALDGEYYDHGLDKMARSPYYGRQILTIEELMADGEVLP